MSDGQSERSSGASAGFFGKFRKSPTVAANVTGNKGRDSRGRDTQHLLRNHEEMGLGWFWATDAEGTLTYLTDAVATRVGLDLGNLGATHFSDLFMPAEADTERQRSLLFVMTRQTRFEGLPLRGKLCEGEEACWWAVSGQPVLDSAGEFAGYRGSGVDITVQRDKAEQSSRLTKYDSLTGLLNRPRMAQLLETTLNTFRPHNRPCAVLLLDLDRFKQVNDTLGHPAGDALLKQVAERLVKVVGDAEKVGRLGGDEFQVVLPDVEDRGTLGSLADWIIASLSQPYSINGTRCIIGASIGIAISPYDGGNSEDLIRNADLALYAAKGGGRGRFRFFSNELLQAAEDRRALEHDLVDALENGGVELHYQPIVNAKTNLVTGCEALIRWNHPERGYISPSVFIPIAEEANLICQLGEWTIRKACDDVSKWPGELRVAVNVSPIQFASQALPGIVTNALATSGLAPDRLELEITEGVFLAESSATDTMFKMLKSIGVRLALDDFGTGYSSLSYLKTAPFDKIKIDQSFVRGATEQGSRNKAIIAAIVALAQTLEMETTAEGIESLDQLDMIRGLNVSHVQGFVYSKAIPQDQLAAFMGEENWTLKPNGPAKQRNDRHSMFRKAGAVHDNHYYPIIVRNMSVTGALIEGILDVPLGTKFIIDFGDGQIAIGRVRRSRKNQQGIEFEVPLVNDGNGGLCTSHRVSPYMLAAAGMPMGSARAGNLPVSCSEEGLTLPAFRTMGIAKSPHEQGVGTAEDRRLLSLAAEAA